MSENSKYRKSTIYHRIKINHEQFKSSIPDISEITDGQFSLEHIKKEFHITIFFPNRKNRKEEDHVIINHYDQELIDMEGDNVNIEILGICFDTNVVALKVLVPDNLKKYSEIHKLYSDYNLEEDTTPKKIFHITYALKPGIKPVYSNTMLHNEHTEIPLKIFVPGVIDRFYKKIKIK